MVFHHDEEAALISLHAQAVQAVCGELGLFIIAQLWIAGGIHADAVAAQSGSGIQPLEMVLDGFRALGFIGITQVAFTVTHDQQAGHAFTFLALFHLTEVSCVRGFVEKHLVHILHAINAKAAGGFGEVEMVQRLSAVLAKDALVQ